MSYLILSWHSWLSQLLELLAHGVGMDPLAATLHPFTPAFPQIKNIPNSDTLLQLRHPAPLLTPLQFWHPASVRHGALE